jgi:heptosyltransferase I
LKILILKPSSLGDVILALPVLRQLKKRFPHGQFYWWISAGLRPLLENDPDLTGLFVWDRQRWSETRFWKGMASSIGQMRDLRFDYVIDLQGLARSAILGWLAQGDHFIGLNDAREGARAFYDTILGGRATNIHAADWYQKVLPFFGVAPSDDFIWLPPNPVVAHAVQSKWQLGSEPWILLNPGARWLNKRWPAENFGRLAKLLVEAGFQGRFGILGGPEDVAASKIIAAAVPDRALDLAGKTSLPELIEWIRLSSLVVSNDTGPIHIAAALGVPVIGLYGPTNPGWTGPYRQISRVLSHPLPCAPCDKPRCHRANSMECLRAIPPEQVGERARELLEAARV